MAEREVVLDGIFRIVCSEPLRNLPSHRPSRTTIRGQPKALTYPNDMGVERHHELRPVDTLPEPEVDPVAPNHPPQIQVESLARASIRWSRKEVRQASTAYSTLVDVA